MKYKSPTLETNTGIVTGLEVQTKDEQWIGFEPRPSSFLIMSGDALMVWSNDRIRSLYHRVLMSGNELRYWLGLFTFNVGIMEVPEELFNDEHPSQYKPFWILLLLNGPIIQTKSSV
ncbi:hypothetical protein RJ639_004159 [Escallonia herrerae]|uniref:Isopenicillin N synthase-like Fe(2+) 2OG dioxygenase domain-containing protein n=1 Tax=Escallonia herrerae TaxID=1293975 RepID=A0AA88W5D5_9ASTE|nr:hypothetical protein RJ639_004159 [Escallonia herrerae]